MINFQGVQQLQGAIQGSESLVLAGDSHGSSPGPSIPPDYKALYAA